MLSDVNFLISDGSLGLTSPSEDGVSCLLTSGVAVSGGLQLNTPYLLTSIESLEALGVNRAYDLANRTLVWHNVDEFFRKHREAGTEGELYLFVADQATATLVTLTATAEGSPAFVCQALAQGRIRLFGVAHVPATTIATPETRATGTVEVPLDGNEGDLIVVKVNGEVVGTYQVQSGDTPAQKATGLAVAIENLSSTTGFNAESDTADLEITAPVGSGTSVNGQVIEIVIESTVVASGALAGGVNEVIDPVPTPNLAQGIDSTVITAVANAQTLANTFRTTLKTPVDFFIEGRHLVSLVNLGSLINFKSLNSPNVSVYVHQDRAIANLRAAFNNHAMVGTALGVAAVSAVNAPISWVERNNLESVSAGRYIAPALSNGVLMKDVSMGNQEAINSRGLIFARTYPMLAGCYFSDSCTATLATSDFSTIENNRVIGKVIRRVYMRLAPKLNAPQQVDATTGRLLPSVVTYYETLLDKAVADMSTNEEVSGIRFTIDPLQNYLTTNKLVVRARITPTGKNKSFDIDIAFENPANA